jgi:hypothetical protein
VSTNDPDPFFVPTPTPPDPPAPGPTQPLIHPDDPDDDWAAVSPTGRGLRVRALTGSLVVLAVLAGGFWGGVVAEKHHGSGSATTSASAIAARFAAAARGASGTGTGGTGGFSGFGGAAGAATSGLVTGVVGNVLYVTNSSGALVKVTVGPSATITRTGKSSLSGLQTGDTVIVSGTKAANGSVSATSVRATAQGVSTTGGGGFGSTGFGGGGG